MEITNNINYSYLIECEKIGELSLPIYFSKDELLELSSNNESNVSICKINDILVGFLVNIKIGDRNHILSIAIHPSYRRKNIATSLINNLKEDNLDITLYVQCVNQNAINLYIKNNFIKCIKVQNYYNSLDDKDAYYMMYSKLLI